LFAALVLVARVTGHHSVLTVLGAHLYFWGRLGYLLAAAAGFSLVRSVLCWNVAVIGILLFVVALLWGIPPITPNQSLEPYDAAGNVIETHEPRAISKIGKFSLASPRRSPVQTICLWRKSPFRSPH
jgi:hypothetical protein